MRPYLAPATLCGLALAFVGCKGHDQSAGGSQDSPSSRASQRNPGEASSGKPGNPSQNLTEAFVENCAAVARDQWPAKPDPEKSRAALKLMATPGRDISPVQLKAIMLAGSSADSPVLQQVVPMAAAIALAHQSPVDFLESLTAQTVPSADATLLEEAFLAVAGRQPRLLRDWLEAHAADSRNFKPLCGEALVALARESPRDCLDLIPRLSLDPQAALSVMADAHPHALVDFIASLPVDSPLAGLARRLLALASIKDEPALALDLIGKLGAKESSNVAAMFLSEWVQLDIKKAGEFGMLLPPKALYDWFSNGNPRNDELLKANPALAQSVVEGIVATGANRGPLSDLVAKAAKFAPESTLAWVSALKSTRFSSDLLKSTMEEALYALGPDVDPLNYLPAVAGPGYNEALEGMGTAVGAQSGSKGDLSRILALSARLPAEDRATFLEASLTRSSLYNPPEVMKMLGDGETPSILGDKAATVVQQASLIWIRKNPSEATDWVSAQPESPTKTAFMSGMVKGWIADDPLTASNWLLKAPSGKSKDAGIRVLAESLDQTDPQAAALWRASLSSK